MRGSSHRKSTNAMAQDSKKGIAHTGKHWMEQHFTHIEKIQNKISFNSGHQYSMAGGSHPGATVQ